MADLIKSLGFFRPSIQQHTYEYIVQDEFINWLNTSPSLENQRICHWLVRSPTSQFSALDLIAHPNVDATGWHRDKNVGTLNFKLIIWASNKPTEVLLPNLKTYSARPYEVVSVPNHMVKHRTPEMDIRTARKRWFARAYVMN